MTAVSGAIPHLFDAWDQARQIIRHASHVALFLDFDGTLVPLGRTPDQVRLTSPTRRVLRRLVRNPRVRVWVISGRRREELRQRLGVEGVRYLGLYGWERGVRPSLPAPARNSLRRAKILLAEQLSRYPDVSIEDKRLSITIHRPYGSTAARRDPIASLVREVSGHFKPHLKLIENLRGWEVIPVGCPEKGLAVGEELAHFAPRDALPVYLGDDLSDEPAFAALSRGLTILVGCPRRTRAHYRLFGPWEVPRALARLEANLT
jgi:trehalose 6-phosphate phosphatase